MQGLENRAGHAISERENNKRGIAFIDIDGTIYVGTDEERKKGRALLLKDLAHQQMVDEIISMESWKKIMDDVAKYESGTSPYSLGLIALNMHWAEALQGENYLAIQAHADDFVKKNPKFAPFTQDLFKSLKKEGYETYLFTGEPQFVADAVAKRVGATGFWATTLVTDNFRITGKIVRPFTSDEKGEKAEKLRIEKGYSIHNSIAIIDSIGDKGLAHAAGHVVLPYPKPALLEYLDQNGIAYQIPSEHDMVHAVNLITRPKLPPQGIILQSTTRSLN